MKKVRFAHLTISAAVLAMVGWAGLFALSLAGSSVIHRQPAETETKRAAEELRAAQSKSPDRFIETIDGESPKPSELEPDPAIVQEARQGDQIVDKSGKKHPLYIYKPAALPNDPQADQWWVDNIGMEAAWNIGSGATPTTVAVIDTGFDLNHEELAGRWALNGGEQGVTGSENSSDLNCTDQSITLDAACNNIDDNFDGIVDNESGATTLENPSRLNCTDQSKTLDKSCNRIDDDGNGLVDDWRGWDFVNYDAFVEAGETNPDGDETFHGTMVAGILAATGNNGVGIAGINWSTDILPIQVFDDDGYADTLIVSRAIRYAAERGADVISLSLGTLFEDEYLRDAVADATDAGSLVVAAAGNDGCNCLSYPANFPEVLAVGSSDSAGDRSYFSSYGNNLDLLAPGSSLTAPIWNAANDNSYALASGTSFSTPLVSGLMSLARSHQPQASWAELMAAMLEKTDRTLLSGAAFSSDYGFGIAQADDLMSRVTTPLNLEQVVKFSPLDQDDQLDSARAYQCLDGQNGATALYEMQKNGNYRYTVSQFEKESLKEAFWNERFLGYSCLLLPDDDVQDVRLLNLAAEFSNQNPKLTQ